MPDEIANLPDLQGYLKIAQFCAPIKLKPKRFAALTRKFVPLIDSTTNYNKRSIEKQWKDFEE